MPFSILKSIHDVESSETFISHVGNDKMIRNFFGAPIEIAMISKQNVRWLLLLLESKRKYLTRIE
jgi:hypothetical protein